MIKIKCQEKKCTRSACVRGAFSLIGAVGYARPISNHVGVVVLLQQKREYNMYCYVSTL